MITLESVVTIWSPNWAIVVFYAALVIVLTFRPSGLFGRQAVRRSDIGQHDDVAPDSQARPGRPAAGHRVARAGGVLALLAAVAIFPLVFTNALVTTIAVDTLIFVGAATAWNIFSGTPATSRSGMRCSSAAGPIRSGSPPGTGR